MVGSTALGAYREGRSDIDFVAVVDDLDAREIRRLRALHILSGVGTGFDAIRRNRSPLTGTCNGVYVREADLTLPVSQITPVAAHIGTDFSLGKGGSDVSPVGWKVLAEQGITMRGLYPSSLGLDPEPDTLRAWNLGNLESYWRPWANRVLAGSDRRFRLMPRWATAWGALGAPRLHHTIATGEVISKEEAGVYALDVVPSRWHTVIRDALSYWRMETGTALNLPPATRAVFTAELVLEMIESAQDL